MNGKIFARIIAALVLVAAVAGIAFFAFNAGVAQGVATKLLQLSPGICHMHIMVRLSSGIHSLASSAF